MRKLRIWRKYTKRSVSPFRVNCGRNSCSCHFGGHSGDLDSEPWPAEWWPLLPKGNVFNNIRYNFHFCPHLMELSIVLSPQAFPTRSSPFSTTSARTAMASPGDEPTAKPVSGRPTSCGGPSPCGCCPISFCVQCPATERTCSLWQDSWCLWQCGCTPCYCPVHRWLSQWKTAVSSNSTSAGASTSCWFSVSDYLQRSFS